MIIVDKSLCSFRAINHILRRKRIDWYLVYISLSYSSEDQRSISLSLPRSLGFNRGDKSPRREQSFKKTPLGAHWWYQLCSPKLKSILYLLHFLFFPQLTHFTDGAESMVLRLRSETLNCSVDILFLGGKSPQEPIGRQSDVLSLCCFSKVCTCWKNLPKYAFECILYSAFASVDFSQIPQKLDNVSFVLFDVKFQQPCNSDPATHREVTSSFIQFWRTQPPLQQHVLKLSTFTSFCVLKVSAGGFVDKSFTSGFIHHITASVEVYFQEAHAT